MKTYLHRASLMAFLVCLVSSVASTDADDYVIARDLPLSNGDFIGKPAIDMKLFSPDEQNTFVQFRDHPGNKPSSLAGKVISLLKENDGSGATQNRDAAPKYSISKNDIIDLLGAPSHISTNKPGKIDLIYNLEVNDPLTKHAAMIVIIVGDIVRQVVIAGEL
ncbi:MAG: hypothetical protein AB7V14_00705 [Kiritimatiellia bacterium]